jgi:hypothetical protein
MSTLNDYGLEMLAQLDKYIYPSRRLPPAISLNNPDDIDRKS